MNTDNKLLVFLLTAMLVLASCSSNKRGESDSKRKAAPETPDMTIYAVLNAVEGDTIDMTGVGHGGRKYRLSVTESRANGAMAGDLNVGDTMAVMTSDDDKEATSLINLSQITGLWLIGGGDGDGLRLASDGGASWIGADDVTMRSWCVRDGKFILKYIKADGSDYKETPDTAGIKFLDKDSMVVTFKDRTLNLKRSNGLITVK